MLYRKVRMRVTRMTMRVMRHCKKRVTARCVSRVLRGWGPYIGVIHLDEGRGLFSFFSLFSFQKCKEWWELDYARFLFRFYYLQNWVFILWQYHSICHQLESKSSQCRPISCCLWGISLGWRCGCSCAVNARSPRGAKAAIHALDNENFRTFLNSTVI